LSCPLPPAAEHRQISDTEYKQFTDTIIDKLIDAERVTSLVLKDLAAAATAASNSATLAAATTPTPDEQQAAAARRYGRGYAAVLDENFVADAAAEELRERLQQLAKQVVDLQVRARAVGSVIEEFPPCMGSTCTLLCAGAAC
jgi:centrosomal protein CEP290